MDVTSQMNEQIANQVAKTVGLGMAGLLVGMWLIWLAFFLVIYLYFGFVYMTLAKKTKTENSWWAWVPILNLLLFFKIARKPLWWVIFLFIPLVNLIMMIVAWMEIAKIRGKPDWVGILLIVPIIGPFIPAYLAFVD